MTPRQKRILAYIRKHPGADAGDVAEALDIPLLDAGKEVNKLLKTGKLTTNQTEGIKPRVNNG